MLKLLAGVHGQASKVPVSSHPAGSNDFRGNFYFLHTTSEDFSESQRRPLVRIRNGENRQSNLGHNIADDRDEENPEEHDEGGSGTDSELSPLEIENLQCSSIFKEPSLIPLSESSAETILFDFFVTYICPGLSHSTKENPYWEFIVPLSLTSVSLFYALLSWAANGASLANPTGREVYNITSARYKVRALRELRKEIASTQGDWLTASDKWAPVLATVIMLSCNDITEVCSQAWLTHLKAARVLCSMAWPKNLGVNMSDKFRRFCIMWFVSHDIMSRTAWIQETLFDPTEWFASDDETEIDPMIACSRGLIHQVSAIGTLMMDLRRAKKKLPLDDNSLDDEDNLFQGRRNAIETALRDLRQELPTNYSDCGSAEELLRVAESKRLCALIYLYTCIDTALPSSLVIQGLTSKVIGILTKLQPKPSITFTLFVVGTLGVRNEDDRRTVLEKFNELIETRWLASIVRARDVVTDVWLDRDLGKCGSWEDLVETKSRLLSLA